MGPCLYNIITKGPRPPNEGQAFFAKAEEGQVGRGPAKEKRKKKNRYVVFSSRLG
jgi:hypothetical protein